MTRVQGGQRSSAADAEGDKKPKVGICLSGGGLRAASFGLGALQALQQGAGLVRGKRAASYLAAVSGGSYTAASVLMVAQGACGQPYEPDDPSGMRALDDRLRWHVAQDTRYSVPTTRQRFVRTVGGDGHPKQIVRNDSAGDNELAAAGCLFGGPVGMILASSAEEKLRELEERKGERAGSGRVSGLPSSFVEADHIDGWKTVAAPDPLASGSLELQYLRRHTRYLIDHGGIRQVAMHYAWRLIVNLLVLVSLAAAAGFAIGGLLAVVVRVNQGPLPRHSELSLGVLPSAYWAGVGVLASALLIWAAAGATVRRRLEQTGDDRPAWQRVDPSAVGVAAIVGLIAVPVALLSSSAGVIRTPELNTSATIRFLGAAAATLGALGSIGLPLLGQIDRSSAQHVGSLTRRLQGVGLRIGRFAIRTLAGVIVPVIGFGFVMGAAAWSFAESSQVRESAWWGLAAIAVAMILSIAAFFGAASWSLHSVYRRLLFSCFGVMRRVSDDGSAVKAEGRHASCEPRLSDVMGDDLPELLVCATANVTDPGYTPAGVRALPFVFSPSRTGVSNVRLFQFDTRHLEDALEVGRRDAAMHLTLPAAVAITGAAVSPVMGRMTRDPVRALIAVLNLRLGMWLPNPLNRKMREAVEKAGRFSGAPLRVKPGPLYLLRELFGSMRAHSRWIYVSDGGHTENLGLVELLRRKCDEIWCVDASGDRPGSATALAQAMLMASGELGVRFEGLDLSKFELAPDVTEGRLYRSKATWIQGEVVWPDAHRCRLIVIKLGLGPGAPPELVAYQRQDPRFPYHSTVNQVYTAEVFDAYVALGRSSAEEALTARRRKRTTTVRAETAGSGT